MNYLLLALNILLLNTDIEGDVNVYQSNLYKLYILIICKAIILHVKIN